MTYYFFLFPKTKISSSDTMQTSSPTATPIEQNLKSFGISLAIVVGAISLPILGVGFAGSVNVSRAILKYTLKSPGVLLIALIVVSLGLELLTALIPTPEVRDAFAMLSRLVSVGMWIVIGLLFVAWLVIESYDTYAKNVNLFSSYDVGMLISPAGRLQVHTERANEITTHQRLWNHVSGNLSFLNSEEARKPNGRKYPRLDIRPLEWMKLMSKQARNEWKPIISLFFPWTQQLKLRVNGSASASASASATP